MIDRRDRVTANEAFLLKPDIKKMRTAEVHYEADGEQSITVVAFDRAGHRLDVKAMYCLSGEAHVLRVLQQTDFFKRVRTDKAKDKTIMFYEHTNKLTERDSPFL